MVSKHTSGHDFNRLSWRIGGPDGRISPQYGGEAGNLSSGHGFNEGGDSHVAKHWKEHEHVDEQFKFIMNRWDKCENEQKGKGPEEAPLTGFTMNSGVIVPVEGENGDRGETGGDRSSAIRDWRCQCLKEVTRRAGSSRLNVILALPIYLI